MHVTHLELACMHTVLSQPPEGGLTKHGNDYCLSAKSGKTDRK